MTDVSADPSAMPPDDLRRLVTGAHHDPHSVLGVHADKAAGTTLARAYRPGAKSVGAARRGAAPPPAGAGGGRRDYRAGARSVALLAGEQRHQLAETADGVFTAVLPEVPGAYVFEIDYGGDPVLVDDPYRWLPTLGELDLHLMGEGRHERLWNVLGAHGRTDATPPGPR